MRHKAYARFRAEDRQLLQPCEKGDPEIGKELEGKRIFNAKVDERQVRDRGLKGGWIE